MKKNGEKWEINGKYTGKSGEKMRNIWDKTGKNMGKNGRKYGK